MPSRIARKVNKIMAALTITRTGRNEYRLSAPHGRNNERWVRLTAKQVLFLFHADDPFWIDSNRFRPPLDVVEADAEWSRGLQ